MTFNIYSILRRWPHFAFVQDVERVIEEAKRQAKLEAHSNLSSETKRIAGDNKRMAKELRFQMQVLMDLLMAHSPVEDARCVCWLR